MIYVNGTPLNFTLFPDNTSQVWHVKELELPNTNWIHIKWDFQYEGEFMQLSQLKTLIDHMGFRCALRIGYLPYGRQDKEVSNNSTFALRTFATLLNSLNFEEIIIIDPHSDIATKIICNARAIYPINEVDKVMELTESTVMCFPDKGAVAKYKNLYSRPYIWGEKVRDQSTGEILYYKLVSSSSIHEENVLIVDDLIDGGMTFKLLAEQLLRNDAKEVNLFATHGIFSKGLKTLHESGIKKIFTQYGQAFESREGYLFYEKY